MCDNKEREEMDDNKIQLPPDPEPVMLYETFSLKERQQKNPKNNNKKD